MAGSQHLLAIAMAFISAGVPGGSGSKLEAVGVIVEANHASLSGHSASEGTTIFDGDQMSTEAEGSLDLQIGQAVFHLADRSSAVMHDILHDSASNSVRQFDVELLSGAAVLSVTAANSGGIAACGARIQPIPQTRGIVRVQIAGPHELVIYAKRGAAQISYRGETENIEEGKTYRVRLSADDEGGQGGAITKSSGHSSKLLLVVAVVVGAATAIAAGQAASGKQGSLESPDHP
jgi:hypothetical protein